MTLMPTAHLVTIKWGNKYPASDVNKLYASAKRHIHAHDLQFHCFTEDATGLHPQIHVHPLPQIAVPPEALKYVYRKEVGLCDDALGGLTGQRVLFLDLDVLITGDLDDMLRFPQGDAFVIINDWNTKDNSVGQASCYSWVVGTLGFVKSHFEADPHAVIDRYFTASQAYLSAQVIERYGALQFWPQAWCRSFKKHALPPWYLRLFVMPRLPEHTKILAFHGDPKIADALRGVWQEAKRIPWYKRCYKTLRPSTWIAEYWQE